MADAAKKSNHNQSQNNQGEGNPEAARRFNRSASDFAQSREGKRASKANHGLDGQQKREAEQAEEAGRKRAHEKDPQVVRDYDKAEK